VWDTYVAIMGHHVAFSIFMVVLGEGKFVSLISFIKYKPAAIAVADAQILPKIHLKNTSEN
jgi:hypothetical protein